MTMSMDSFLKHFANIRERTRRVAKCIPDDRIEWAPREGMFTLGDLVRHIAVAERFIWAESIHGRQSKYVTHGRELADGKAAVLAFLDRMHEEATALFLALPPEAMERCANAARATRPHPAAVRTARRPISLAPPQKSAG